MKNHDRQILKILQENNRTVTEVIAQRVGLSPAAVHRHIKKLRDSKVIEKDIAVIAQDKVDLPMTIVVTVQLERERIDLFDKFKASIRKAPEVQQCYYLTGSTDFLLIVVAKDMREFEAFTQRMFFGNPNVRRFETSIVMDRVKVGLALPLGEHS